MSDKPVDAYLNALKFVPDWFVTNEILDGTILSKDNIVFADIDYNIVAYLDNDMSLYTIRSNNNSLDDDTFEDYDPETIIHFRPMAWFNKYMEHKVCEKEIYKCLMPLAWHSTR